jgi:hypothetical protein
MTLKWDETANDQTLIQTIAPQLHDQIWHDGTRWWRKEADGTWRRWNVQAVWHPILNAINQLPDTPYWARSRQRIRTTHGLYHIAAQLAYDCTANWPRPADLTSPCA